LAQVRFGDAPCPVETGEIRIDGEPRVGDAERNRQVLAFHNISVNVVTRERDVLFFGAPRLRRTRPFHVVRSGSL